MDMECLSACTSLNVKKGGARLAKVMRTMAFLATELPTNPTDSTISDYDFELEKYNVGIKRASTQYFEDQDSNSQAYKIIILHCAPSMISKLKTMAVWIKIEEEQDRMGLIKLVHGDIFAQDGSRQSIAEYVSVMKKLFLLFQVK